MIRIESLSKSFPTGPILDRVTWQVNPGDRLGLVGPNGAGKTTFLRLLLGELDPDEGTVVRSPRLSVGYLPQEQVGNFQGTLHEEMWTVFQEVQELSNSLHVIAEEINQASPEELHRLVEEQSQLQVRFELAGGYTAESQIGRVLFGLGFLPEDHPRPLREFSGGWQMRAALAKLLLARPDLLLLDEPTNHLDVSAIEWLEDYLSDYPGAIVLISHDRMFLDSVVNRITELEDAHFTDYTGTYSEYVEERSLRREALTAAFERQQKDLKRQEAGIERFRYSARRSKQAKSREKQLSKIERIQLPRPIPAIHFRFPPSPSSGELVLAGKGLSKRYDKEVFRELTLELHRGDRLALVGPNGCGKTTFLRMVVGEEAPTEGTLKLGHGVRMGYYSQQQADRLDGDRTVLEEAYEEAPDWSLGEIRSLLARFLFREEDVFKKVHHLSGGEKSRLALAKLLLHPANLLVLDEPTNHLDIQSKDTLAAALVGFQGTVLLVSHDRYLLDQIATRVLAFEETPVLYDGDYAEYRTKREERRLAQKEAERQARQEKLEKQGQKERRVEKPKPSRKALSEVEALEAEIIELEEEIMALEARLGDPSLYADPEQAQDATRRYQEAKDALEAANERWLSRVESL